MSWMSFLRNGLVLRGLPVAASLTVLCLALSHRPGPFARADDMPGGMPAQRTWTAPDWYAGPVVPPAPRPGVGPGTNVIPGQITSKPEPSAAPAAAAQRVVPTPAGQSPLTPSAEAPAGPQAATTPSLVIPGQITMSAPQLGPQGPVAQSGCAACGPRGGCPQPLSPAAPCPIYAVDCASGCCCGKGWEAARLIDWQRFAQGEYVGHARTAHVAEYRLRVDDQLDMIFRVTRDETATPYKLNVGDEIRVESFTDPDLNRELILQPDGTISLRLLGQVHATGLTVPQLKDHLEELYKRYYKIPAITIIPLRVNTKLEDLRATIDRRAGVGGQSQLVRVTPEGTIALPAVGSLGVQGLTLPELQLELNERYRAVVDGIEIIPVLAARAPRFVYVLGEVKVPGRYEMTGPTTAIQSITMAGGWNIGANLRQVVVFRRGDDWRLMATMLNLQPPLYANQPCPPSEIWLSDSDIVIVPKGAILVADEFINLVFTRGIYGVLPMQGIALNFSKLSTL